MAKSLRVRVVKLDRFARLHHQFEHSEGLGNGVRAFLQLTTITLDQKAATLVLPLLVPDRAAAQDPWALPLPRLKSIILESCDCTQFSELFRTLQSVLGEGGLEKYYRRSNVHPVLYECGRSLRFGGKVVVSHGVRTRPY
jgi:hypothetical protein